MTLMESLAEVEDFRIERCKKHKLIDILLIVLLGFLYEYTDIESIADFADDAINELRRFGLKMENGAPSADTIHRVLRGIDSGQLERAFVSWSKGIFESLRLDEKNEIVAIDGKTVRGSADAGKKGVHIVSAWADEVNFILGQVKTEEKSNEITAIPELLELLDLKNIVVTIDAMGCQKDIARKIKEKKSEYVFSLKGNQGNTHKDVKDFFAMDEKTLEKYGVQKSEVESNGGDHGRLESRQYFMCSKLDWLGGREEWEGLKSVVMAVEKRVVGGKESVDRRYFLTSLDNFDLVKRAIRRHWGIENRLHWCLDMDFREDWTRSRKDNSPQNLAVMRKIAMNLLRTPEKPAKKRQDYLAKRKRWFSWNAAFRLKVLQAL